MNIAIYLATQVAQTTHRNIQNLFLKTKTMENSKQTTIPMDSIWNNKWVAGLLAFIFFCLIMGFLFWAGGEFHPQDNYAALIQTAQVTFDAKQEAKKQADMETCEATKELAHEKMRQHVESPLEHPLSKEKLVDLDQKQSKDCGTQEFIPTAKALSFETSSFNTQDNAISFLASNGDNFGANNNNSNEISSIITKHPVMIKGSPSQQQYIDYAWNTYHDKNLVYLMKAENGLITPDRQHSTAYYCPGKKGVFHDWGFGGISDCYHPEIVKDPRFFSDPQWQIDQVYNLYKGGTKFASRPKWASMKQYFTWI